MKIHKQSLLLEGKNRNSLICLSNLSVSKFPGCFSLFVAIHKRYSVLFIRGFWLEGKRGNGFWCKVKVMKFPFFSVAFQNCLMKIENLNNKTLEESETSKWNSNLNMERSIKYKKKRMSFTNICHRITDILLNLHQIQDREL